MTLTQSATTVPAETSDTSSDILASASTLVDEIATTWDMNDELDAMCRYAVTPAGKLFRPYLLLEACSAVGGDLHGAVPAAIGAEYGHVASLVHDDIIDGDLTRRGRPAVHAAYGRDHAIVVGDSLIFRLFLALPECADRGVSADRVVASLRAVASAGVELCRGQTLETRLCGDPAVSLDDYRRMVRGKTAALFRGSCEVGALLGGGDDRQVAALGSFGEQLGIAFQMVDDLLAYQSNSGAAGKDLLSDVRNRRMTFPLIVACQVEPEQSRRTLHRVFTTIESSGSSPATEQWASGVIVDLLKRTSALAEASKIIDVHAATALEALEVLPRTGPRDRLGGLVTSAVERAA